MNISFKNKTVLVTAGSKGIGLEIAKYFISAGANVCICSRKKKNLDNAKKTFLRISEKSKFLCLQKDISIPKNHSIIIKKIKTKFNKSIDILINNSGGPPAKSVEKTTFKDWNLAISSNLMSGVLLSKLVINSMKKKKWGRIINLTSTTAKEPADNMALSNVTRAALTSFSKTLSREVAKYGITVNTILTGGCLTDRFYNLLKKSSKNKKDFDINLKKLISLSPMKKIAKPEEFIQLIVFLASENSSYINGSAIPIDGGSSRTIF